MFAFISPLYHKNLLLISKFILFEQFEINKKRDTELLKLRKLLEDVHLESEETAHLLRKKHQEVVVDFQDQIDQMSKARARLVFLKKGREILFNFLLFTCGEINLKLINN